MNNMDEANTMLISIHALRKESDTLVNDVAVLGEISIHALRKESDDWNGRVRRLLQISIHALRKESDAKSMSRLPRLSHFNPRSP